MKWEERKFNHEQPETIKGLVSIIIPTFNRKEFLLERIHEIQNDSTYRNFEIIVINDGGDTLTESLPNNIRLFELSQNSKSVSIPRNIGISYARGEYICPADDDVIFLPKKLEKLVNAIGNNMLCYGNRNERRLNPLQIITQVMINDWNPLQNAGVDNGQYIYRKEIYEKLPYIISTHACDFHLAKEIYRQYGKFNWIQDVISEYIWHDTNRTYSEERKKVPLDIAAYKDYFNVHNDFLIIRE